MVAQSTAWSPIAPSALLDLLHGVDALWWLAGGYAIERFVGHALRPHGDIDVLLLRPHAPTMRRHLVAQGWDLHYADPPGTLQPWRGPLPARAHNIWCRPAPTAAWGLQLMIDNRDGDHWLFRRDPAIRRPIAQLAWPGSSQFPVLSPAVQLLYKAKQPRDKDQLDFAAAEPLLDRPERAWLADALAHMYPDGHAWRDVLTSRRGPA